MSTATKTRTVTFSDGSSMERPKSLGKDIIILGKTDSSLLVVTDNEMPFNWALTSCCNASGIGTEWGVACRACYDEAPWECADVDLPLAVTVVTGPAA